MWACDALRRLKSKSRDRGPGLSLTTLKPYHWYNCCGFYFTNVGPRARASKGGWWPDQPVRGPPPFTVSLDPSWGSGGGSRRRRRGCSPSTSGPRAHHITHITDCRWVAPLWRSPPVRAQRQRWRLQSPGGSRNCDLAKRGTAAAPPRSRERHRPFCRGRHAGGGRPHRPKVKAPVSAGSPQRAVALLSGTLALPRKALAQHAALTGCPPSPAVVAPTARPCTVTIDAAVAVAAPAHTPGTAIALK